MQYTRISKIFFMVFILLSFSACSIFRPSTASGGDSAETQSSSTSKEAKGTADKSQKNLQSNICKGKIDRDGVSKLTDFVAQPTAFFCNMANKQLLALEHQHRALGNLEKETQAKQAREKISNGTMGTGLPLAIMIAHTPSDEEKAATYARNEENRKKMGATAAPSGSGKIADSDYAKSVRSSQAASADSGPLGKRIREALGSSYKTGGSVSKASSRADGIAQRGKTRGKMC